LAREGEEAGGGAPRARYQALAGTIRADIREGRLKPGDAVPTEHELAAAHGVSRFTVREALRQLTHDGLISRKRGSGTVVVAAMPVLRQGFADTAALLQYAASSSFLIGPPALVRLGATTARLLKRPSGEAWYLVKGVRVMDGAQEPVAFTHAWIHPRFGAQIPKLESGHEALFSQLKRLAGLEIGQVSQSIEAVAATRAEAGQLHVPVRSPCLRILRHYHEAGGALAEMSCSVHPGARFSYTMLIDG
jgi:DNA-binding GntR family transcriptional regulator